MNKEDKLDWDLVGITPPVTILLSNRRHSLQINYGCLFPEKVNENNLYENIVCRVKIHIFIQNLTRAINIPHALTESMATPIKKNK